MALYLSERTPKYLRLCQFFEEVRDSSGYLNTSTSKIKHRTRPFASLAKGLSSFIYLALLCHVGFARANPESGSAAEYAVKAAYIYNILRFVSWDKNTPLARSETLNICLFKEDPFSHYLDPIRKKSIGKKKIELRTIDKFSQSTPCHLIFINNGNYDLDTLKNSNSILLGNNIEFVKNGGLFSFYIENNKVRLAANKNAIANTNLNISSQLLEVSRLYGKEQ